jgi:hypothetical protein
MMVSPQVGEWAVCKAGCLVGDENMERTAALPRYGKWAANGAYGSGFIKKGEIDMERYKTVSGPRNIGWLTIFPIRLVAGLVCLLTLNASATLMMAYILLTGFCAALFCLRCKGFRTAYMGVAALGLALGIAALPESVVYLIAQAAVEAALIPAIYRSRRVKEAFFQCGSVAVWDAKASHRNADPCLDTFQRIR